MLCLAEAYKRWRHTRGYGVHSPFAYRMVGRVVRPPRGYLYYLESALSDAPKALRHDARLLVRLAAELDIRSASIAPDVPEIIAVAIQSVRSDMKVTVTDTPESDTQLILGIDGMPSLDCYAQALASPSLKAIWIKNPPKDWANLLFDVLPEGVMFRGREAILIIPHPGMQKIAYTVSI